MPVHTWLLHSVIAALDLERADSLSMLNATVRKLVCQGIDKRQPPQGG